MSSAYCNYHYNTVCYNTVRSVSCLGCKSCNASHLALEVRHGNSRFQARQEPKNPNGKFRHAGTTMNRLTGLKPTGIINLAEQFGWDVTLKT